MSKILFYDSETTGLNSNTCGLIEIAGTLVIDDIIVDQWEVKMTTFPSDVIEESALEKNGVTMEELQSRQSPENAFLQLISHLEKHVDRYDKNDKYIVCAYVADFDNRFLRKFFEKNYDNFFGSWFWHPWIDIMNLAAYILQKERTKIASYKQESIADYLGIAHNKEKLHGAAYDRDLALEIYYKLTSEPKRPSI